MITPGGNPGKDLSYFISCELVPRLRPSSLAAGFVALFTAH
jgi:hypothetical protein